MSATTDRLALTLPAGVKRSSAVAQSPSIVATPAQRPPRPTSAAAEVAALVALAKALGEAPDTVCQLLADHVLALLKAGSAGVSVLSVQSDGTELVCWPAISGRWQTHSGSSRLLLDPGDLAREATTPQPTAEHALIVPFGAAGKTSGTVWAVAHDAASNFGAEDLRRLQDLALFAVPALQAVAALRDSTQLQLQLQLQLQQQQQQQHATFNSLIENAPFGVYLVDAQFRLCKASAAARKAFASVQPLIGRNFGEAVHTIWPEPFASEVLAHFRHTLDSGEAYAEPTMVELRKDTPEVESYDWKIERIVLPDGGFGVVCYFYDLTERQQAAEALRLRAAQFETLFNGAPLGIYLVDADLRIRQVNPVALPEFGDIPGLIGQDLAAVMLALWGPARADDIVQLFRHTLNTGEPFEAEELVALRFDRGATACYEWQIHRIPLPDGSHGVVCHFREISKRVQAQAQLRDSEMRFRAFVTASSDVVYRMSPDWLEMRQAYGRNFVVDTLEPSVHWLQEYIHPQDQAQVLAAVDAAIANQSIFELEHRVLLVDGELGWTRSRAVPLLDEDGAVMEWFGTASDITEARRAQQTLLESKERYRNLFNSMDQGYCVLEMIFDDVGKPVDYRFLQVNPAFAKLSGLEDAEGRRIREMAPDMEAHWFTTFGKVALTGEPQRFIHEAQSLGSRCFDVYAQKIGGPDSGKVGVLFTNITERKRGEEERMQLVASLQQEGRRKSEFLAMLAHELRNPLAPIRNAVQILQLCDGNRENAQPIFEMMERQIAHMVRLVDDLLDVSRISHGTIELKRERVELAAIVRQAGETVRPLFVNMDHELTITLPAEPIHVNADPARLTQVLGNLLHNACKFTERGGRIRLTIEPDGDQAVIRVEDNGVGISAEHLAHVFDMFAQLDTSLERSRGGLGLGLTLVKTLIEMHGGSVEVRSGGVGRGTEFVVRLQMLAELSTPPKVRVAVQPLESAPLRILVVDDNQDAADSMAFLLQLDGHETRIARDGLQAVEAAAHWMPDVVLLDIGLPKLDGYEAARRIRAQRSGVDGVMLIAITGWGQDDDRRRSRDAGFDAHLTKPVGYVDLAKLLAQWRGGKK